MALKVDLHQHSSDRSQCGRSTAREMAEASRAAGLDVVFFTDHHKFVPGAELETLNMDFAPLRLYCGVEINVIENEDFLVYGVKDAELETRKWTYADLYRFVRERKGLIIYAHPYRFQSKVREAIAAGRDRDYYKTVLGGRFFHFDMVQQGESLLI